MTYRQLRERGFKGTKYDAELMIAQGFTLAAATTHQQHTVAPFLGKLKVGQLNYKNIKMNRIFIVFRGVVGILGSVLLSNGSGCRSGRPKNIRILRIWIHTHRFFGFVPE